MIMTQFTPKKKPDLLLVPLSMKCCFWIILHESNH